MKPTMLFPVNWATAVGGDGSRDGGAGASVDVVRVEAVDRRPVVRTIFAAQGARAQAVCTAAADLSARWMQTQPPLACIVDGAPHAAQRDADEWSVAIRGLAARSLAAALHTHGYHIERHDELRIFAVVDVGGETSSNVAAGEAAELQRLLRELETRVHTELRARTTAHVLMLAEPAHQRRVAAFAAALRGAGIAGLWLAGPVSQSHQRLDEASFLTHTARGLAALAWGAFPSHAVDDAAGEEGALRILGAAGWDTELPHVRRWLALRSASACLAGVRGMEAAAGSENPAGSADAHEPALPVEVRVEELAASIARSVPRPLPPLGAPGPIEWPHLSALAVHVTDLAARANTRHTARTRQARMAWLDAEMDGWRAWLQAFVLPLAAGDPAALGAMRSRLETLTAATGTALERLGDLMEAAAAEVDSSRDAVRAAADAVTDAAQFFPAYSLAGLLRLALQVWRWPAWTWLYVLVLPARCRDLALALAREQAAVWNEANLHAVRQYLLIVQQELGRTLAEVLRIDAVAGSAADVLAGEAQELAARLAPPWTLELLQGLWVEQEAAVVGQRMAAYVRQAPLAGWADAAAVARELAARCQTVDPPLAGWCALDCLAEGLARAELVQRDPLVTLLRQPPAQEPFVWLDRTLDDATPLWPRPALAQEIAARQWLLLPFPCRADGAAAAFGRQDSAAGFQWWADTQREPADLCRLAGDAVVVLRWLTISARDLDTDL